MWTKNTIAKTEKDKIERAKKKTRAKGPDDAISDSPKSLYDHGIFFFNGDVDDSSTGEAIKFILEANLDTACNWKYITMLINSPGGYCTDGFALIDIMMGSQIPIRTIGLGMIASMGLQIFLTGEKGYRTLTPNCMILSHQYAGGTFGKEHELLAGREREDNMSKIVIKHYMRTTGLTENKVREILLPPHDVWLTAKQAKKYGVCDIVKDLKPNRFKTALIKKKIARKKIDKNKDGDKEDNS